MKNKINHYGRIRSGKLILDLPDLYNQEFLELEGCDVVVNISKRFRKPTQSQYGYYRGVILVKCHQSEEFIACDRKDDIHDTYFAPKFLSYVVKNKEGKEVPVVRSLADISKDEMTEFISRVIAHCESELGIRIPPAAIEYNKFYPDKETT